MDTETWEIYPDRGVIEGEGPMPALRIRRDGGEAEWHPDEIEGYDHRDGVPARIEVAIEPVPDPPAGASSLRIRLLRRLD